MLKQLSNYSAKGSPKFAGCRWRFLIIWWTQTLQTFSFFSLSLLTKYFPLLQIYASFLYSFSFSLTNQIFFQLLWSKYYIYIPWMLMKVFFCLGTWKSSSCVVHQILKSYCFSMYELINHKSRLFCNIFFLSWNIWYKSAEKLLWNNLIRLERYIANRYLTHSSTKAVQFWRIFRDRSQYRFCSSYILCQSPWKWGVYLFYAQYILCKMLKAFWLVCEISSSEN